MGHESLIALRVKGSGCYLATTLSNAEFLLQRKVNAAVLPQGQNGRRIMVMGQSQG